MKRLKQFSAAFLLLVIFCMTVPITALAEDNAVIENWDVQGTVDDAGVLDITNTFSLKFTSEVNGFYLSIDNNMTFSDLQISREGQVFEEGTARSGEDGIYSLNQENGSTQIKMYSPASSGERKTITVRYKVVNAVTKYADTADLYYFFIPQNMELKTEKFAAQIHIPSAQDADQANKIWVHSQAKGECKIDSSQSFSIAAENIRPGEHLEGRMLFSPQAIPKAAAVSENKKEAVIEEENSYAEQQNAALRKQTLGKWLGIGYGALCAIIAVVLAILLYFKCDKEPKLLQEYEYYRELPEDVPPAQVAYLYRNKQIKPEDFSATIMDLNRKGYLDIIPVEPDGKRKNDFELRATEKPWDDLRDFESYAMQWLTKDMGTDGALRLSEMEFKAKLQSSTTFSSSYSAWASIVKDAGSKAGYFDDKMTGLRLYSVLISMVLAVGSIFLGLISTGAVGIGTLISILSAAGIGFYSSKIRRRSVEGNQKYHEWRAFRRFLRDFSNLKEAIPQSIVIWKQYLVYAITLGVADEVIEQLRVVFPEGSDPAATGSQAYWLGNGMMNYWMFSSMMNHAVVQSVSQSVSAAVNGARSTTAASMGGGGGFSSGGFGGGGVGGGGGGGTF